MAHLFLYPYPTAIIYLTKLRYAGLNWHCHNIHSIFAASKTTDLSYPP